MMWLSNEEWFYWGHKLLVESDRRKLIHALDIIEGRAPKYPAIGDYAAWLSRNYHRKRKNFHIAPPMPKDQTPATAMQIQHRIIMRRLRAERRGEDISIYPPRIRARRAA